MKNISKRLTVLALTAGMAVTMAATALAAETPFTDVSVRAWYSPYVKYTYEEKLFVGTSDTTFSPSRAITRAELVTVLGRMHQQITNERPDDKKIAPTFSDIEPGRYYTYYVGWAQKNGLVAGYADGSFHPNEQISREMLAEILNNYIKSSDVKLETKKQTSSGYTDQSDIAAWAANAVKAMTGYGFLSGNPDGSFAPKSSTTRAETCAVVTQVYQGLNYSVKADVNHQYIRYDGLETPVKLIDGAGSYRIISSYDDYDALVKAAQEHAYPREGDTFTPVNKSYFEKGNILAVELQQRGCPQYETMLSKYYEFRTTGYPATGTAEVTFFSQGLRGSTSDTPGYIFLIEVPKYITRATVYEVNKVEMWDNSIP